MLKQKYVLYTALLLAFTWFGCSKEQTPEKTDPSTTQEDAVLKKILKEGFKRTDIVEEKDRYIVQGDIIFYKEEPGPQTRAGAYGTGPYSVPGCACIPEYKGLPERRLL